MEAFGTTFNEKSPGWSLPVIAYYLADRTLTGSDSLNGADTMSESEAMFSEILNEFDEFVDWFISEENHENRRRLNEGMEYKNPHLEAIRNTIETFFGALSEPAQFAHLQTKEEEITDLTSFKKRSEVAVFIIKKGKSLKLSSLSDGEKMLLMLVCDITRRLVLANTDLRGKRALKGKGIVLIDEIELHLHPSWQRAVVPALEKTFPNIQFIVTTHSPQVISNVKVGGVFGLVDNQILPCATYGKDSNWLLEVIMNDRERPAQVQKNIDEYLEMIRTGKLEAADVSRKKLEDEMGDDLDPVFVKGDILTRRKKFAKQ
jgi:predicted ATP-binding protein involved in virulence